MARGKGQKMPVTRRALLQRIARKLAKDRGQMVRAERQPRQPAGTYFVLEPSGRVVGTFEDPVKVARELGILHPWEQVVEGGPR
jgi:hypothetical protein